MTKLGAVEAVEGYYLSLVLDALHQSGVLERLNRPADVADLARELKLDVDLLTALLKFAAMRSTLVECDYAGRYRRGGGPRDHYFTAHMLDQYVGGYGPPLARLAALLGDPSIGIALVDGVRHAAAFARDPPDPVPDELLSFILGLGATGIVELGCGGGQLLCDAAAASPTLVALGIDANPAVAAAASVRAAARGVSGRVRIACGDALQVLAEEEPSEREAMQIVVASSVLNAFWRAPGSLAAFLTALAALMPGRILLVSDYFSHLGRSAGAGADTTARTLIHDIAQLVSGQGLPPVDRNGWIAAYRDVGATLLHDQQANGDGVDRFVHLVRLAG